MAARGRDAPIGGQAVLEGVMMRGVRTWSVAVRAPTAAQLERAEREIPAGEIAVQTFPFSSALRRHRVLRLPLRARRRRARRLAGDRHARAEHLGQRADRRRSRRARELSGAAWVGALVVSFAFAVGLFFVVPVGLVSLVKSQLHSSTLFWLIEGVVRTAIFLGYLLLLSRLRDLRRVFEYHGAEHKTIACYEAGSELTPENAAALLAPAPALRHELPADRDDRRDLRLRADRPAGLVLAAGDARARVPLIAGISFEIIKFAARHRDRALGARGDGAGAGAAAADDARARPQPARRRDRGAARGARRRGARPAAARADLVGLEVVA